VTTMPNLGRAREHYGPIPRRPLAKLFVAHLSPRRTSVRAYR